MSCYACAKKYGFFCKEVGFKEGNFLPQFNLIHASITGWLSKLWIFVLYEMFEKNHQSAQM